MKQTKIRYNKHQDFKIHKDDFVRKNRYIKISTFTVQKSFLKTWWLKNMYFNSTYALAIETFASMKPQIV